jgi:hypothetical protein
MPADTVDALLRGRYSLYAMFSVRLRNAAARPTIAFASRDIMETMALAWSPDVSAYVSVTPVGGGQVVQLGRQTQVEPGQILHVTAGGLGYVTSGGPPFEIAIENMTASPFTSGFARAGFRSSETAPIFAAPLHGHHISVASALPKLLLQFTTETLTPGTVLERSDASTFAAASYGPALLVTAARDTVRAVAYDINRGWRWGGENWARAFPPDADLTELLIEPE